MKLDNLKINIMNYQKVKILLLIIIIMEMNYNNKSKKMTKINLIILMKIINKIIAMINKMTNKIIIMKMMNNKMINKILVMNKIIEFNMGRMKKWLINNN